MQNRYTGDVGDFVKYGLLRALCTGRRLGVAWYLHPDQGHNEDGGFVQYLREPDKWRHLDSELFDGLKRMVDSGRRCVKSVEQSGLLQEAVFASDTLCCRSRSVAERAKWRREWFEDVRRKLSRCDVVFADPDNGLCPDDKFDAGIRASADSRRARQGAQLPMATHRLDRVDQQYRVTRQSDWKRLPLREALRLCDRGRAAVFYHHHNREGAHSDQIRNWKNQLPGQVHAYYWRRYSNRTFFVVNADRRMVDALQEFEKAWGRRGELDPDCT